MIRSLLIASCLTFIAIDAFGDQLADISPRWGDYSIGSSKTTTNYNNDDNSILQNDRSFNSYSTDNSFKNWDINNSSYYIKEAERPNKIKIKNTPNPSSIGLTSSDSSLNNGTCFGSGGASTTGPGFGLTVNGTYMDLDCNRRYYSMLLKSYGRDYAAIRIMCFNEEVRYVEEKCEGFILPENNKHTDYGELINKETEYKPINGFF